MFLHSSKLRLLAVVALASLVCLAVAEAKKPPRPPGGGSSGTSYTIVKLDDANGLWECLPEDVNNLGTVVGYVTEDWPSSERYAACWEVTGDGGDVQSRLSLLTGGNGAFGVNDTGEIVGYGNDPTGRNVGLYWPSAAAAPLLLPPLSENGHTTATAINNDGVVCGSSDGEAVAWRVNWAGGEPTVWGPLPLPTLDEKSWASAISNNDQDGFARIVGMSRMANGQSTAAVAWTVQSLSDGTVAVDPLPQVVEAGEVDALGVNDGGTICGEAGWPTQAIVWTESGSQTLSLAKKLVDASAQDIGRTPISRSTGGTACACELAGGFQTLKQASGDHDTGLLVGSGPRRTMKRPSARDARTVRRGLQAGGR
jgi:hypothetical protein